MNTIINPDDRGTYDYGSVPHGDLGMVYLSPNVSPVKFLLLDPGGRPLFARPFEPSHHSATTEELFGLTVLGIPPAGIRMVFFTPLIGINFHIGSDVMDNVRRSAMKVYAENGDEISGDRATEPFGPVPDPDNMLPTMDPKTTDSQWMIWNMNRQIPGYPNPLNGIPVAYADFFPDSLDVFMGPFVPRS